MAIGAALTGAALACGALVALPQVLSTSSPEPGEEVTVQSIVECLPPQSEFTDMGEAVVTQCLEDTMYQSVLTSGVAHTDTILKQAEQASPKLSYVCHDIAHTVGRKSLPLIGSLDEALSQLTEQSCNNGLMHGFTDQLALEDPTEEQMKQAVTACETILGDRVVDCADALGHLFWTTYPELDTAAVRCDWFSSSQAVQTCTTGVIMRMVSPQPETDTPTFTQDQIAALCPDWPLQTMPAARGCALGIAYAVYALESGNFQDQLLALRSDGMSEQALDEWVDILTPGRDLCLTVESRENAARCLTALGDNMAYDVPEPRVLAAWCGSIPRYAQALCLTRQPDLAVDSKVRPIEAVEGL